MKLEVHVFREREGRISAYNSSCIPVKHIIISVSKTMKQVPEELPQVSVIWFILKLKATTEI